ncbi:NAD-dependent succinate-semialdehyde dehydrogenase [Salinibacter altiplanensis]|uniref:NAD-dependent succinate-semialdehyde dehydrogenase n=1 Tax=Salinibacter altiplanensis TaxID=1803181 RepID=UPI000C9F0C1D|nr:NAD-dependent succinate-semialdehyde dehydrogenase [Salinibacter altiplanensis]
MPLVSKNPTTENEIERYSLHTDREIEQRLAQAMSGFETNRDRSFGERAARLERAADLLEDRAPALGALMTEEMGKPLPQARAEAEKCAWVCRYYAEHGADFLADQAVETPAQKSYVAHEPLGPILAVMPWNFPFWQAFRFGAPALMAGNVVLLKHAPNVTGCAEAIADVLRGAGFADHELQVLRVDEETVGTILEDRRVRGATLTGSVPAGAAVAQQAAAQLKPTVLELGGSDPFIVCADADLEEAASTGCTARMQNNGQSCIAAKRFIVTRAVLDDFRERLVENVAALTVGDPTNDATDVGPMARGDLRDTVHDQVERALGDGAVAVTGGHMLERDGFFYAPTVLADVEPGTVAFEEEIFGPVASITAADDAEHAVALANNTRFGLGGSIFTEDLEKGERMARALEAGCVFVNEMTKSDPRVPFGGIKDSGYGRELSHHGIHEFVNVKTVWVEG